MKTYHDDPVLKANFTAEMERHRKLDQFIRGHYGYITLSGKFRGCGIGCAVDSLNRLRGVDDEFHKHSGVAETLGWPLWLTHLYDLLFEGLPNSAYLDFALALPLAVPVGTDKTTMDRILWRFTIFLMDEHITALDSLPARYANTIAKLRAACTRVRGFYGEAIETGKLNLLSVRSAEFYVLSASEFVTISSVKSDIDTARSAADAVCFAACLAAESAESEVTAYQRQADKLIELLKESKNAEN